MLIPCSAVVYADTKDIILSNDSISFIETKDRTLSDVSISLYNHDDEVIAYYYSLIPKGYVICNTSGDIIECSIDNAKTITNKKTYYVEPTVLCNKSGDKFINLSNGNVYNESVIVTKSTSFTKKINDIDMLDIGSSQQTEMVQPRARAYNTLSGTCRTYSFNPTGICGSTAAAIFFMYYNDHIDDYMVLSSYETSDGVSLITLLEPHIDGEEPGSNTTDLVSGMNWYLRWKGQANSYTAISTTNISYSSYRSIIDSGRPVIIDLNSAPTYGEHWVVGYGYELYVRANASYEYYIVNDGWGSNSVFILSDYVGDAVYLRHL